MFQTPNSFEGSEKHVEEKLNAFEKLTFQGDTVAIVGNNNRDRVSGLQVY